MAANYTLAWLEDELFPAPCARLSIELDLCSFVRIKRDVLNLLAHPAAHADMCPCKVRGLGRAADLHLLVGILLKPLLR